MNTDTYRDFQICNRAPLSKFILTTLKRNILPAKLKANKNVRDQINFTAKLPFILPIANLPLSEELQGNGVHKFSIHM